MAKRFTKPSINWSEIDKRVPPDQRTKYLAFKSKSDGYLKRVFANPEELPKIDWDYYKKLVPSAKIVENFKSEYEKIKIPYPQDTLTSKIDEQWKSLQVEIETFCKEQQKIIDEANKELSRIKALPKYEEMTMEMFCDMYPDKALDPLNRPTFWPHDAENQPGYIAPEQKAVK